MNADVPAVLSLPVPVRRGRLFILERAGGPVRRLSLLAQALELAWVVALSTLIPLGIGLWLDKRFGTAPWLTLVGMVIGVVASTVNILRQMNDTFRALDEEYAARQARRQGEKMTTLPAGEVDEKEETD